MDAVLLAVLQAIILSLLVLVAARAGAGPQVQLQPPPNSHTAPVSASIVASFTTAIDAATVSTRTFAIHGGQQGLLTGTYEVSGGQVTMTPSTPFFPGELVQGVVTTGTRDVTGTALAAPVVWQFRTAAGIGPASFISRPTPLDSTWSLDVALGDLDDDGDLDIFLNHRDAASTLWFNDGSGNFTTNGIDMGNDFLIDLALGDLDGDGDLDAIQSGIQDHRILRNEGQGMFSPVPGIFPGTGLIHSVALGDVDGDGDLDAVTVTACDPFDPNQACDYAIHRIWLNDGDGGLQPSDQVLGHGTAEEVALGDLDGDGDLDALLVSFLAPISAVWTNVGGGVFTITQALPGLSASSAVLGDLDNDGDLDAFIAPPAGSSSAVWLNDGNGMLAPGQYLGALGAPTVGDIDGDGDLDAISAGWTDSVWLNQGDGTFAAIQFLGNADSSRVALGDVDGDGDLDAVVSGTSATPELYINAVPYRYWFPVAGLP